MKMLYLGWRLVVADSAGVAVWKWRKKESWNRPTVTANSCGVVQLNVISVRKGWPNILVNQNRRRTLVLIVIFSRGPWRMMGVGRTLWSIVCGSVYSAYTKATKHFTSWVLFSCLYYTYYDTNYVLGIAKLDIKIKRTKKQNEHSTYILEVTGTNLALAKCYLALSKLFTIFCAKFIGYSFSKKIIIIIIINQSWKQKEENC